MIIIGRFLMRRWRYNSRWPVSNSLSILIMRRAIYLLLASNTAAGFIIRGRLFF